MEQHFKFNNKYIHITILHVVSNYHAIIYLIHSLIDTIPSRRSDCSFPPKSSKAILDTSLVSRNITYNNQDIQLNIQLMHIDKHMICQMMNEFTSRSNMSNKSFNLRNGRLSYKHKQNCEHSKMKCIHGWRLIFTLSVAFDG